MTRQSATSPLTHRNWGFAEGRQGLAPSLEWGAAGHPTWLVPWRPSFWGVVDVSVSGTGSAAILRQCIPLLAQVCHHLVSFVVNACIHLL